MTIDHLLPSVRLAHHYQFHGAFHDFNRYGYCYAFHLFDRGVGTVMIGSRQYPVRKGTLFFVPPKMIHGFHTDPDAALASYNIYCDLWMASPPVTTHHLAWEPEQYDSPDVTTVKPCPEIDGLPAVIQLQQYPLLIELFTHIVRTCNHQGPHAASITTHLLHAFLLELSRISQSHQDYDPRIQRIIERMEQSIEQPDHYETWLAQCGLQKSQFHELFRKMTGLPPKAYVTRIKMQRAAAALRESNQSVTHIAEWLGYSTIHHFTRQFTAYYGISPTRFRGTH
ncbi:AraC family transcriptional regulator [Paenibacillus guangzhouensis]|uniref:AraC family transcriptional regulator n=1 Tax=Paenibacillus guangzhouensis TaxID=1473112 RepID=UPI00187B6740|nr:AraC family transcriptional regulator [Paenibacillus guangzhouensis]